MKFQTITVYCTSSGNSASATGLIGGVSSLCGNTDSYTSSVQGVQYTCRYTYTCCYSDRCNVCPSSGCVSGNNGIFSGGDLGPGNGPFSNRTSGAYKMSTTIAMTPFLLSAWAYVAIIWVDVIINFIYMNIFHQYYSVFAILFIILPY